MGKRKGKGGLPDALTYYKYWEARWIRSPADRVAFRGRSADFTNSPLGQPYRHIFDSHLKVLLLSSSLCRQCGGCLEDAGVQA